MIRTRGTRFKKAFNDNLPYFRLFPFLCLNGYLREDRNYAFPAVSGWFRLATIQKLYNLGLRVMSSERKSLILLVGGTGIEPVTSAL